MGHPFPLLASPLTLLGASMSPPFHFSHVTATACPNAMLPFHTKQASLCCMHSTRRQTHHRRSLSQPCILHVHSSPRIVMAPRYVLSYPHMLKTHQQCTGLFSTSSPLIGLTHELQQYPFVAASDTVSESVLRMACYHCHTQWIISFLPHCLTPEMNR